MFFLILSAVCNIYADFTLNNNYLSLAGGISWLLSLLLMLLTLVFVERRVGMSNATRGDQSLPLTVQITRDDRIIL
jgi:hypothetical protein